VHNGARKGTYAPLEIIMAYSWYISLILCTYDIILTKVHNRARMGTYAPLPGRYYYGAYIMMGVGNVQV
jgi:hypothetical protein